MATPRKARAPRPGVKLTRIRIDVPAEADPTVLKALRAAAKTFPGAKIEEAADAPADSYSLTVHVLPDKQKEE